MQQALYALRLSPLCIGLDSYKARLSANKSFIWFIIYTIRIKLHIDKIFGISLL